MIVANDISREDGGFDSDLNTATLITAEGDDPFPLGPKSSLAARILDRAEQLLDRALKTD
jgi:phosphopantothenoylcysteine synthetase/decarboxylase